MSKSFKQTFRLLFLYFFGLKGGGSMDYDEIFNEIMLLKRNPNRLDLNKRTKRLIQLIGEHPNSLELYQNIFLSPIQVKELQIKSINGYALSKYIVEHSEIKTTNLSELTYNFYGYVRTITPAFLNQIIDDVATRLQLEKEYADIINESSRFSEREDELTLGEIEEFS